jgi:hypothetical protein
MNLMSDVNRSQEAPNVIKPVLPNGDALSSDAGTSPSPSPSPSSDPALQSMQSELKSATCDVSWNVSPDVSGTSTSPNPSEEHRKDTFKVGGAHCPIAFSDFFSSDVSADYTSDDFSEEMSYAVSDTTSYGKLNDVIGVKISTKTHTTNAAPLNNSQPMTAESGSISGRITSRKFGLVTFSGNISSSQSSGNVVVETRLVFQFTGFQVVLRDDAISPLNGNGQQTEKAFLNGVQLSPDEMKRIQN